MIFYEIAKFQTRERYILTDFSGIFDDLHVIGHKKRGLIAKASNIRNCSSNVDDNQCIRLLEGLEVRCAERLGKRYSCNKGSCQW